MPCKVGVNHELWWWWCASKRDARVKAKRQKQKLGTIRKKELLITYLNNYRVLVCFASR